MSSKFKNSGGAPVLGVDLVAALDGSFAEMGRPLNDEQLAHAEMVISLAQLLLPHQQTIEHRQLRLTHRNGRTRAVTVDGQVVCVDLDDGGPLRTQFTIRARAAAGRVGGEEGSR